MRLLVMMSRGLTFVPEKDEEGCLLFGLVWCHRGRSVMFLFLVKSVYLFFFFV